MNTSLKPQYSISESALLSTLNWPNGKIALVFAIIFIIGVIYRVHTDRSDIYDATKNLSTFFWGAAYFRTLSILSSIIHKSHAANSQE